MIARYFALVMGIGFVIAAVSGFIPALTPPVAADAPALSAASNYGYLFGLFPVNALHSLIHLVFGVLGLVSCRNMGSARRYAQGLAIVLAIFTVVGLIPPVATVGGLLPLYGNDIWFHAVEAIIAAFVGFFAPASVGNAVPAGR
ncbi:MAG: DUF4383 domain-containing protein [Anaerolineae bacterium]|nr:DUF4383 domain-containing protein [Anaerolineae bacterium]